MLILVAVVAFLAALAYARLVVPYLVDHHRGAIAVTLPTALSLAALTFIR